MKGNLIDSRRLLGALLVVFGYMFAVNISPAVSDEYASLAVAVAGVVGVIVGLWLVFTRRQKRE